MTKTEVIEHELRNDGNRFYDVYSVLRKVLRNSNSIWPTDVYEKDPNRLPEQ